MQTRKLTAYVVWFSPKVGSGAITRCLDGIWDWITSRDGYAVASKTGVDPGSGFKPWISIDGNLALLLVGDYWSAGDICGTLKHRFLQSGQEVIAFKIDPEHYIPQQGIEDKSLANDIVVWSGQINGFHLVEK